MKAARCSGGDVVLSAPRGPHADTQLGGDARGGDCGVREELAGGIMDCPLGAPATRAKIGTRQPVRRSGLTIGNRFE
jgi:hypothetical protein